VQSWRAGDALRAACWAMPCAQWSAVYTAGRGEAAWAGGQSELKKHDRAHAYNAEAGGQGGRRAAWARRELETIRSDDADAEHDSGREVALYPAATSDRRG